MIALHRLTHPDQVLLLNPDLIQTIEATPDTVVSLTNASKFVVIERPYEVVARIREWRSSILTRALEHRDAGADEAAEVMHLAAGRPEPLGDAS
ncbi:MAG TPA: flagellar FlbD family protein [Gaiellaceae bacterium]|nr:flagellar FlbD family protein [Gaiellaceae bacterium]